MSEQEIVDPQIVMIGQAFMLCLIGLTAWTAAALFMALP